MNTFWNGVGAAVAVGLALLLVLGLAINGSYGKWAGDRFVIPGGDIVRIRLDDKAKPLFICADSVNGELKNCLSAKEIAEAARGKWRK